ncbi:MarR family winged helix-turn-helix transcriptional regulator [Bradyrhizobium elkanii]|uniref:MarR family winged helix-turn-helix transcriptional regulator n=1 Tax=Bradyrhizobium elkanii TaxID=29448 RepID=UPI0020A019F4|nr:MarR family transcriptional regulator [Bradyrhizobium elkanii]MCP1967582.1 DNA-binding MarR family transcriptional regulator [Bradyrhizobium elkanii]MCS3523753.1 DNA-binding MarR family transcriptional regulator [Bradyrhizobium elkanii]MCS4071408.1 DNA-binding MarR family transcriptional regulator [Bradyrhizobium elkanii]MCS4078040.1 DNA-binding MarR family transcriptional regulator [Bradyrhizobium elkanii]MCS4110916.1 DNA-binding MarR family transcriptional regulator [Bradyrhizobium elkani
MKSRTAVSRTKAPAPRRAPQEDAGSELVIDFERYVPTVLSSLVAKLRANANAFFPQAYGVSLAEWRVLSFLREHEPASAYDIWTNAQLDKAVVSRETTSLKKKGLIELTPVRGSARNRTEIRLTSQGVALLDRTLDEILRRHSNLTAGLDARALESFFRVVAHIEHRIPHMADQTSKAVPAHAPVKRIAKRRPPTGA